MNSFSWQHCIVILNMHIPIQYCSHLIALLFLLLFLLVFPRLLCLSCRLALPILPIYDLSGALNIRCSSIRLMCSFHSCILFNNLSWREVKSTFIIDYVIINPKRDTEHKNRSYKLHETKIQNYSKRHWKVKKTISLKT